MCTIISHEVQEPRCTKWPSVLVRRHQCTLLPNIKTLKSVLKDKNGLVLIQMAKNCCQLPSSVTSQKAKSLKGKNFIPQPKNSLNIYSYLQHDHQPTSSFLSYQKMVVRIKTTHNNFTQSGNSHLWDWYEDGLQENTNMFSIMTLK